MAEKTEEVKVDETPISPIERRNSLEKHLQTRPDPKDLKDRHILLDTNAAPYGICARSSLSHGLHKLVHCNQPRKNWNAKGQQTA